MIKMENEIVFLRLSSPTIAVMTVAIAVCIWVLRIQTL